MTKQPYAEKSYYEQWMEQQGIPIVKGWGVRDVRLVERAFWSRLGGNAAFIHLTGMEGVTGMFVADIPPRGSLKPQKHLYNQLVYIFQGHGATEVWLPQENAKKAVFEWKPGSLFAIPLNCWHKLHNAGSDPVLFLAVNDAPLAMDYFRSVDFVFGCDYCFTDRFNPDSRYFDEGDRLETKAGFLWETNFIADVNTCFIDPEERKGSGVRITHLEMADSTMGAHLAEWPVGRYHKAHHHQGGAVLLILRSSGYSLMWPIEAGIRPYQEGRADFVVRVDWGPGAVFSPPSKWFHQHFNTGNEPARQMAFRPGTSTRYRMGFVLAANRMINGVPAVFVSVREGGNLIEYEDEDPKIRQDYEEELRRNGVSLEMPPVVYRSDNAMPARLQGR